VTKIPFRKPALTISKQIGLLKDRGMLIPDVARAEHYLRFIGYYRLSGYLFSFQNRDGSHSHDCFKPGANFEVVLDRYVFDRRLRVFIMDAAERIEVAARTAISNSMSERFGAHWYLDSGRFETRFNHPDLLRRIKQEACIEPLNIKKQPEFIRHYLASYDRPLEPPSWMVFELLSFGAVSKMFAHLVDAEKKHIAEHFNLPRDRLQSWLHAASHLRNLCAHHSRVWNREFGIVPTVAKTEKHHVLQPKRLYNHLVAFQTLLKQVSGDTHWAERLPALLAEHPEIPVAAMGFPPNWKQLAFWR
jgi:abortive infection bacteriophage resistance protein